MTVKGWYDTPSLFILQGTLLLSAYIFSNYIANNYLSINFDQFRPLLDLIDQTIVNYHNLEKTMRVSQKSV